MLNPFYLGPAAIDENTPLTYTSDDIRLCTIQRSSLQQSLGIEFRYHKHEEFYYVGATNYVPDSLPARAGIKCYDRVIEVNGTNVEFNSYEKFSECIANAKKNQCTIQLLVCSPATYVHYKTNNKSLHSNLETVKLMKPIRDDLGKI